MRSQNRSTHKRITSIFSVKASQPPAVNRRGLCFIGMRGIEDGLRWQGVENRRKKLSRLPDFFCSFAAPGAKALFPSFPDRGAVAYGCLPPVADDRGVEQRTVLQQLLDLVLLIGKIGKRSIRLAFFIDQRVQPAGSLAHTVQFAARYALLCQIDHLEFDAALFEPTLGFFRVKAFVFAENLNIHHIELLCLHYSRGLAAKQGLTNTLDYCIIQIKQ